MYIYMCIYICTYPMVYLDTHPQQLSLKVAITAVNTMPEIHGGEASLRGKGSKTWSCVNIIQL